MRALFLLAVSLMPVSAFADVITVRADPYCPYNCEPKSEKEGRAVARVAGNVVNVYPFVQARYFVFGGIQ